MKVYQAINAVSTQLAREGISKSRKNEQQGYKFRGIDEVMNALAPLLANHKLIVFPRMMARTCEARATRSGGALYSVTVEAEFDFVSAEDGSKHTARTFGEGMDSADKATNKAMSAAYKYAAFMTFCIPLEGSGDVDADAVTPEETTVEETKPAIEPEAPRSPLVVALERRVPTPKIQHPTAKDSSAVRKLIMFALEHCETMNHLIAWGAANGRQSEKWPLMVKADQSAVLSAAEKRMKEVKAKEAAA